MKKIYASKKAKRRAEYLERKKKREQALIRHRELRDDCSIEDIAMAMDIKLR